eukprot:2964586-Alexandrium_andersonii.AAC.1
MTAGLPGAPGLANRPPVSESSARERREAENEQAVGGMRAPHRSAQFVSAGPAFRDLARPVLLEHIRSEPGLR